MPCKMWDDITYPLRNFSGATIEVGKWTSNLISHYVMDVITIHVGLNYELQLF